MLQKLKLRTKVLIAAFLLFIMIILLVGFLSFSVSSDSVIGIEPTVMEEEDIDEPMPVPIEEEPMLKEEPVKPEEPEIFTIVEDMPEFPGGQKELFKFIGKNIKHPPIAREKGIAGNVFVTFIIMEDGVIEKVQIKRGLAGCPECDAEAIRVVKEMPKWIPGKQRGKPVRVEFILPIRFKLE